MKNKSKLIITLMLFIILTFSTIYNANKIVEELKIGTVLMNESVQVCEDVVNDQNTTLEEKEACQTVIDTTIIRDKPTFYATFTVIIVDYLNSVAFFLFLIIVAPSVLWTCKMFKSKSLINYLTRESSKTFLKQLFKESYSYIWIFLFNILLIVFICSFSCEFVPEPGAMYWQVSTVSTLPKFLIIYLINLFLYLATYINIALAFARKCHNYIITVIVSFMTFSIFNLINEFGIVKFLYKLFPGYDFTFVNFINAFGLVDLRGLMPQLILSVSMFAITFAIVIMLYGNKEKLLKSIERKSK